MELSTTLNRGVESILKTALRTALQNPRELMFLQRFARSAAKAAKLRKSAETKGLSVPPFLIASITSQCNLRCKGCYATSLQCQNSTLLSAERWDALFEEAEGVGISFILLAGGEPFLRPEVIRQAAKHPRILFPIFTNGTCIDKDWTAFLDKNRNILPILSIEGDRIHTDLRRGEGVFDRLCAGMDLLRSNKILFGASVTVTSANLEEVTSEAFIRFLQDSGGSVCIFVEYVPTDPSTAGLAVSDEDRSQMLKRLDSLRRAHPMVLLAFPGDEQAMGGCLAAGRGFFHINAAGGAEPCPFSPYSDISLKDHSLADALSSPLFVKLRQSDLLQADHQGGCVLFAEREEVEKLSVCPHER